MVHLNVSRRNFVGGLGAAVLGQYALPLFGQSSLMTHDSLDGVDCGVASGEPTADAVILWTRIPPVARSRSGYTEFEWEIATNESFNHDVIVQSGVGSTHVGRDWTVKLSVKNLQPDTFYWYRFRTSNGWSSVVGRTRTLPPADGNLARTVHFAFISCQDFSLGFYNVFQQMATDKLDFVVHLGDAIYAEGHEIYQRGAVRSDLIANGNAESLSDYRAKYLLYLSDRNWREVRRLFPLFVIHDDHELWNNYPYSARSQHARVAGALQAYSEYSPNTIGLDEYKSLSTWRSIRLGNTAELFALDLRSSSDGAPCNRVVGSWGCSDTWSEARSMLGQTQKSWLKDGLGASKARWKVLLNEVMMMPFRLQATSWLTQEVLWAILGNSANTFRDVIISGDSWDGYPAERQHLTEFIYQNNIQGVISLAGDIHNYYAGSLHVDPFDVTSPIVGHEIVGASVSSNGIGDLVGSAVGNLVYQLIRSSNPQLGFIDLTYHGYTRVSLSPSRVVSEFIAVDTIKKREARSFKLATTAVQNNELVFL